MFDLSAAEAEEIVGQLRATVSARWEALFSEAGLDLADHERFATCFRRAGAP